MPPKLNLKLEKPEENWLEYMQFYMQNTDRCMINKQTGLLKLNKTNI